MCGSPAFLGLDKASVSPKVKHSKEPLHLSSADLSCGCDSNTALKACLCDKGQLQQMRTGGGGGYWAGGRDRQHMWVEGCTQEPCRMLMAWKGPIPGSSHGEKELFPCCRVSRTVSDRG